VVTQVCQMSIAGHESEQWPPSRQRLGDDIELSSSPTHLDHRCRNRPQELADSFGTALPSEEDGCFVGAHPAAGAASPGPRRS
jgi:hypothetical protein